MQQWVVEGNGMPAKLSGDLHRFEYLISTLLCNAFKRGGFISNFVLVKVRCWYYSGSLIPEELVSEEDLEERHYLQVEVTDQGPKMTKQEHRTILTPLTNLRQEPLDKCNLSDIRLIVKAMNAKLSVRQNGFNT